MGQKITIFDAEKSVLHTLNQTAGIVFTGIQLKWDEQKIIKKITTKYKVDETEVTSDVKECLADLLQKKIITI